MGLGDAPPNGAARGGGTARVVRGALFVALVLSAVAGSFDVVLVPSRTGGIGRVEARSRASLPPPATENPSWSGELAWATKNGAAAFDHVTGAWVQPSVAASSSAQYADTWVGVDGYDGKLLQTGTTAVTRNDAVSYEPWFVAWTGTPSGTTVIDEPVAAGDHMRVEIDRDTSGAWSVQLDDESEGWRWSTTVTYPASGSSAEWIEEAPGTWSTPSHHQTLADYDSVTFTTAGADGEPPGTVTTYDIADNGAVVSYPSTYDAAQGSFDVRYGAPTPTLHEVTPKSGPAAGGATVVLTGGDLGSSPVVRFGGSHAAVVRSTTRSLVVRAPAHLPGDVPVTVTAESPDGVATAATPTAKATDFEYESSPGYDVVLASGRVARFGSATGPSATDVRGGKVVGLATDASTGGFWEATSSGGVYDVDAPDLGTLTALVARLSIGPVSGIVATLTGSGYWLVTAKGAIYDFGSAGSFGTLRDAHLRSQIVGMSATPTGHGYWLVAADGAVFPFGKARDYGSGAGLHLPSQIVGMSATPTGHGYWLAAADGTVVRFGKARDFGSAVLMRLGAAVVGIAASTTGAGYWLVTAEGRVFAFGAARFCGSATLPARTSPAVGILVS